MLEPREKFRLEPAPPAQLQSFEPQRPPARPLPEVGGRGGALGQAAGLNCNNGQRRAGGSARGCRSGSVSPGREAGRRWAAGVSDSEGRRSRTSRCNRGPSGARARSSSCGSRLGPAKCQSQVLPAVAADARAGGWGSGRPPPWGAAAPAGRAPLSSRPPPGAETLPGPRPPPTPWSGLQERGLSFSCELAGPGPASGVRLGRGGKSLQVLPQTALTEVSLASPSAADGRIAGGRLVSGSRGGAVGVGGHLAACGATRAAVPGRPSEQG